MSREAVQTEAAAWVVRLDSPRVDAADVEAFEAWRAADPAHEAAYEREAMAWSQLSRLKALRPAGETPDLSLFEPEAKAIAPASRRPALRWLATAAALTAVVVGAGAFGWSVVGTPAYATAIGERRVVMLADGTRVELNTDSRIRVRFRGGERRVELVKGEALFAVARDARPFVVDTGQAEVRAPTPGQASEMAVRLQADGASVVVREGAVEVDPAHAAPQRLAAGTEGVWGPTGGTAHRVSAPEIDRTLAWRNGAIDLDGQSLREAVDEFNRYNTRRIVVADGSIADLRLGGWFRTHDVDGFVRALRTTLPVKATVAGDGSVFLSRAG